MAERYGAGTAVTVEWRDRLVRSKFRFVEQPKAPRSAGRCRNEAMQLARSTAAGLVWGYYWRALGVAALR